MSFRGVPGRLNVSKMFLFQHNVLNQPDLINAKYLLLATAVFHGLFSRSCEVRSISGARSWSACHCQSLSDRWRHRWRNCQTYCRRKQFRVEHKHG